jgi:hypothetical protein
MRSSEKRSKGAKRGEEAICRGDKVILGDENKKSKD